MTRGRWSVRTGLAGLLVGLAVLACSDSSAPPDPNIRPPGQLNILRLAQSAPPLFQDTVSFWARYDQDSEAFIYFQDSQGGQGEKYLDFKVPKFALLSRPDGTGFSSGDSILISIRVVNPDSLLFEFQPAGLKFNPLKPAEFSLEYNHAGGDGGEGDYNDDGVVNAADDTVESELALWQQENPGDSFVKLSTLLEVNLDEIEAKILGFSRYALAY